MILSGYLVNGTKLRALMDTGASENFIRKSFLKELGVPSHTPNPSQKVVVKLATGMLMSITKRIARLDLNIQGYRSVESFIVIDMDDQFEVIIGMPWFTKHRPQFDWDNNSLEENKRLKSTAPLHDLVANALESDGPNSTAGHVVEVLTSTTTGALDSKRCQIDHGVNQDTSKSTAKLVNSNTRENTRKSVSLNGRSTLVFNAKDPPNRIFKTRGKGAERVSNVASQSTSITRGILKHENSRVHAPEMGGMQVTSVVTGGDVSHVNITRISGDGLINHKEVLENPPTEINEIKNLVEESYDSFLDALRGGDVAQICYINQAESLQGVMLNSSSVQDELVLNEKTKIERFETQGWESLKKSPFYSLLREFEDVFPEEIPCKLPVDKGVQHEIDLVPGTKYCVTRQWPLPKEQVKVIDEFFAERAKAGHVRESKSPHCSPTFCVKKATGGWRIVHAFNKLNAATIPAQTPIPRKDVILDGMQGSTIFSTIDLRDGYYQILMREKDIPLTAVSTPSGMLWEWLVMPQGLSNAPATFNRCVSHLLRPCRDFAPSYFDDIFIHSRASQTQTESEVHSNHLRKVLELMRKYKLYANIRKCIFGAEEIPVLGCYVGKHGVRVDPEKVKAIVEWPIPQSVKDLRKWLGLANYLHKYTKNYADIVRPLSSLLRKDAVWEWTAKCARAFEDVKKSLTEAPILALADQDKPFSVVCDASDFAIGCALLQKDDMGKERVISYQSRQLKPAERNYPVHDKELLAMKYALVKFRIYLLGSKPFVIYTDHASLRTAVKTPHLSQRMARWLSYFSEYNFTVEYKPGKANHLADALSRRPDYESTITANTVSSVKSPLLDEIRVAYNKDPHCKQLVEYFNSTDSSKSLNQLDSKAQSRLHRYSFHEGILYYSLDESDSPRILVPHDTELKNRILFEYHDTPVSGHLGRDKTYLAVSRDYYWPQMEKWVRKYVRVCEVCQRTKPSPSLRAPLQSLPIARDCWKSVSMDFIFGLPADKEARTGVLVIVDRFSKMVHLVPVKDTITAQETASVFIDTVFRLHGMPETIISDRDPRFVATFWKHLFDLLGTQLCMSTTAHPESDGQTERVNRVLVGILRSYASNLYKNWSQFLPMAEFAINNSVHVSHGHTPFYVNHLRHPRVPSTLNGGSSKITRGGYQNHSDMSRPQDDYGPSLSPVLDNQDNQFVTDHHDAVNTDFESFNDSQKGQSIIDQPFSKVVEQSNNFDSPTVIVEHSGFNNESKVSETETFDNNFGSFDPNVEMEVINDNSPMDLSSLKLDKYVSNPQVTKVSTDTKVIYADSILTSTVKNAVDSFLDVRKSVIQSVTDSLATAVDRQKEIADRHGRKLIKKFIKGDKVLLSTDELPAEAVSNFGSKKLNPKFIGPFTITEVISDKSYKLDIPTKMRLHPTFYVGRLKPYLEAASEDSQDTLSESSREPRVYPLDDSAAPLPSHGKCGLRNPAVTRTGIRNHLDRGRQFSKPPYQVCGKTPRVYRHVFPQHSAPPPLIDSQGDKRWIVERLLRKQSRNGTPGFLVKWLGYPTPTWEPLDVLSQDVPDLVNQFSSENGLH